MHSDYNEELFCLFGESGKLAVIYELRLRILADKLRISKKISTSNSLEEVEKQIFMSFESELTSEEKDFLVKCRKLRNKLFHSEFSTANAILEDVYGIKAQSIVKKINLQNNLTGEKILEKIYAFVDGKETPETVLGTTEEVSSIYGWLLQIYYSGVLSLSVKMFFQAINVVDRLIELDKDE